MAERIPIMLALSERSPEGSDLSDESVLHSVFGERGWDASVVTPLEQIQNGSTDELCLSGIAGPFVLMSRKDFSQAVEQLSRLRIEGTLRDVLRDGENAVIGSAARSIYFFQLSDRVQFEKSLQEIRDLQSSIHKKVFSLQLPVAARMPIQNGNSQPESNRARPVEDSAAAVQGNVVKAPNHNHADLDRLLDELDESNI